MALVALTSPPPKTAVAILNELLQLAGELEKENLPKLDEYVMLIYVNIR